MCVSLCDVLSLPHMTLCISIFQTIPSMVNFVVFIGCIKWPVSDTTSEHECVHVHVCENVYILDVNHTH